MEGRKNKKKNEGQKGRRNSGGKEERKKKKSSAGFKPVRLVLLVFLSVELEREGVVGRIGFTFLPGPHSSLLFSLQSSSSWSFCSPVGL